MASALYEGTIEHRRLAERSHAFKHRVTMALIDLDELDALLDGVLVRPSAGIVRFRRDDYLGDAHRPLVDEVRALVRSRLGRAPGGPVRVLTHLRSLGHCFNPVSFYYCLTPDAAGLEALVAEVTNTPWGERYAYVFQPTVDREAFVGHADKMLHVSPFMDMDQHYECATSVPSSTVTVRFTSRGPNGSPVLQARLSLRRRPITRRALLTSVLRNPGGTRRVLFLIYLHAAWLRAKGVRIRAHP